MVLAALAIALDDPGSDVWIFRSVLEKRTRMVTMRLSGDTNVAYDATHCSLFRVWNGSVKFDGSVYTGEHGPQPTIDGTILAKGVDDVDVWRLMLSDGREIKPTWRGYKIRRGHRATLRYEFIIAKNQSAWVEETPSVEGANLRRDFVMDKLPSGSRLALTQPNGRISYIDGKEGRIDTPLTPSEESLHAGIEMPEMPEMPEMALQEGPEQNGVALRVYDLGEGVSRIPVLVAGQSPNINKVMPNIDWDSAEDFGMEDNFIAEVTGKLVIPTTGTYQFDLISDDGSRLLINDNVVVDNDGLHGEGGMLGQVDLKEGTVPFTVEYFESGADNVLRLRWKKPGDTAFSVIPTESFLTPRGEVKVTAPGKKLFLDPNRVGRPGDGRPLDGVHPSYDLATVRPATFRPRVGGIAFLPDGRMVVCNWEPEGGVYILNGVQAKTPHDIEVKRFAFGMAEPLGVATVGNRIFVLQKHELTELIDHDKDGEADEYYAVASGWGVTPNFHEFAFGMIYHDGHFYGNLATAINPGGASTKPQNIDRGRTIKIAMDGKYEFIASGLRTPNGIGLGPKGTIFISDNQGDWLPSSKIMHVTKGAFFGNRSVDPIGTQNLKEKPPVVWLPQGEIGNSPGNPVYVPNGPYKGQWMHGDVTHGGVKRVFVEEVGGQLQGCVFRFTQGLEGGVNRILYGPDGALYVGGIGSGGNWGQEGKVRYGLQRLTYNGNPVFEMKAIRAAQNGMEIELTEPMADGVGLDPADYTVRQWKYVPTEAYGGPKVDDQAVEVKSVTLSRDRKRVFLEAPGTREGFVVYVRMNRGIKSQAGREMWSTEGWYTLNKKPERVLQAHGSQPKFTNGMTDQERKDGFVAYTLADFKGYNKDEVPGSWKWVDNELQFDPGTGRGDIVTKKSFRDFDLRLEWKIGRGGNSGIMYHVLEGKTYPWETGPEMQILDDTRHADGRSPLTSAGSLYALIAKNPDPLRPVGAWNEIRILAVGTKVEFWMNGAKIVEYDEASAAMKELLAKSKFKDLPEFMKAREGKIAIQDHGDRVSFRNIRIKG